MALLGCHHHSPIHFSFTSNSSPKTTPFASQNRFLSYEFGKTAPYNPKLNLCPFSVSNGKSASSFSPFSELIEGLINRSDLSESEAEASLDFLLNDPNEALISAFLVLLRAKGEAFEEIVGLANAMMNHCKIVKELDEVVDIVRTGGDGMNTVNISTGASILTAACGAKVAKQGNRSSSSACGSADVLEELGIAIELEP